MAEFTMKELGRDKDGYIIHRLEVDGRLVMDDKLTVIMTYVFQTMRPGDTYQEHYIDMPSSKVLSYEYMMESRRKEQEFDEGRWR